MNNIKKLKLGKNIKEKNITIKAHSTDKTNDYSKIEDLSKIKKKKLNNNINVYDFKRINNNKFIINNLKMNLLYSRIFFNKINKNSFKKNIDTSISVDTKKVKKYHKKITSNTHIKKHENPFLPLKEKRILYFPYHLLNSNRRKSDDKITNKNIKYRNIKTPIFTTQLNKNKYALSPLNKLRYIKYKALSVDKTNKMKNKLMKNRKKVKGDLNLTDDNIKKIERKNIMNINKNINNTEYRQKSPKFMEITALDKIFFKLIIYL